MNTEARDAVILGGGLAGTLLLAALKHRHPRMRVTLVEKNDELGGNHTWCLHDSDIPEEARPWFAPLLSRSWESHEVFFPEHHRALAGAYHAIRSGDLSRKIRAAHPQEVALDSEMISSVRDQETGRWRIQTRDRIYESMVAISCLGWGPQSAGSESGWQKFVGLDLELEDPHGLNRVTLMDARVQQIDGFRFFYVLPWSERELLIEDTYYSNHPGLKTDRIRREILAYAEKRGWKVKSVIREEEGSLPLHLEAPPPAEPTGMPTLGAQANSFNAVTGYTLPSTLRAIQRLVALHTLSHENVTAALTDLRLSDQGQQSYMRMLNRMMFRAAKNETRYRILERFYRLPEATIQRFYAGTLTPGDRARILIGKPPVPVLEALKVLLPKN